MGQNRLVGIALAGESWLYRRLLLRTRTNPRTHRVEC